MKNLLAARIANIAPSPTMSLDARVKTLQASGHDIINLTIGEPDFDTPKLISQAAIAAINSGFTHYTPSSGILELREAITIKLKKENNIDYKPSEIIVGVGTKQILAMTFQTICEERDEVIIPTPTWATYVEQVKLAGATPILLPVPSPFHVTAQLLRGAITSKTKAIILNYPSNPTGSTIARSELIKIAKLAVEKNILIVSDEIYEKIVYKKEHVSIASLGKKIKELTITINGFSKAYAMTGWRIGYAAGPSSIVNAMGMVAGNITSCTSSISQKAAVAALTLNQSPLHLMVKEFAKRKNFVYAKLSKISNIEIVEPEGAFYAFINVTKQLGEKYKNSTQWAEGLLNEVGVAVVPGEAFCAPGYVRISYAASMSKLTEALKRIKKFCDQKL